MIPFFNQIGGKKHGEIPVKVSQIHQVHLQGACHDLHLLLLPVTPSKTS
jgi:hypothetical protein